MTSLKPNTRVTLCVLEDYKSHWFIAPAKRINEGQDVSSFLVSEAYRDIMVFLMQLNYAMFPCSIKDVHSTQETVKFWELGSAHIQYSDVINRLQVMIHLLDQLIDEVPLDTGPRRFGNVSFRKWHELLEDRVETLLEQHLPLQVLSITDESGLGSMSEIKAYFLGSFGSAQRLDYGTGHELSFLAFLGCIWKLGGFRTSTSGEEERSIVTGVIEPYLALVRRLILTYTLEPAGSHGVWGLDDHSFLPYIFGSAQYAPAMSQDGQIPMEGSRVTAPDPGNVVKANLVEKERKKNMYFSAIGFIYDVKKGPFWEHSPTLFDISGVRAGWAKINKGMIKMYNAEVLSKFPVVQHFPFGSLFSWDRDPSAEPPPVSVHSSSHSTDNSSGSLATNRPSVQSAVQMGAPASRVGTAAAHPPNSSGNTQAPWAKQGSQRYMTTRFDPNAVRVAANVSDNRDSERESSEMRPTGQWNSESSVHNNDASMPPPTKAPWAR